MKLKIILTLCSLYLLFGLQSCMPPGFEHTRTEEDIYRITEIDTSFVHYEQNDPENKDRGIINPSSKVITNNRRLFSYDSVITREYPDFIRAGLFESAGLITNFQNGISLGTLGTAPSVIKLDGYRGDASNPIFNGGLYRFMFFEKRLRWFKDAENWTWGLTLFETIIPNGQFENQLMSVLPVTIRKRFYFKETIPYVSITPTLGIAYNPLLSLYLNPSVTFDMGSIGGFNLRAYLGYAIGFNSANTPMIRSNDFLANQDGRIVTIPYGGLGVSLLDFLNLVPETYEEWKNMPHSAWNIGILQTNILYTDSKRSIFQDPKSDGNLPIKGIQVKIINTSIALPILDYNLYAGTTLLNIMYFGDQSIGAGILPLRVGYWYTVLEDELTLEPFVEYNYFPSTVYNIGARLNLKINDRVNISLNAGYVDGNINTDTAFKDFTKFSNFYVGLGFNLWDMIFYKQNLRYFKEYEDKEKL